MTPQNPKRHTQAELDTAQGREITHHVENWGNPALGLPYWVVTCRRRESPGGIQVEVRAATADEAMQRVRAGNVPGIGLGWLPLRAVHKA